MPAPAQFIKYVDDNAAGFIERLAKAVQIPSVSGDASYRKYVFDMATFLEGELQAVGAQICRRRSLHPSEMTQRRRRFFATVTTMSSLLSRAMGGTQNPSSLSSMTRQDN